MTTKETLPLPESTYQLLLDAARAWPDGIPLTSVGKPFNHALAAAGLPGAQTAAAHEDGRLVLTVTGADPGQVRDAVAGYALTVRPGPSPAPRSA